MNRRSWLAVLLAAAFATESGAAEVKLLRRPHDPYGSPRPAPGQQNVPLRHTLYVEFGVGDAGSTDLVLPESVTIDLEPAGGPAVPVLGPGRRFAAGYTGRFIPGKAGGSGPVLAVYADPSAPLRPATEYTVRVAARTRDGATLPVGAGTWRFTTEAEPTPAPVEYKISLADPAVRWHGGFFTGFCNVAFCSSHALRIPTYDLMAQVRKTAPRAWSLQRDFWMTGTEHRPGMLAQNLPNIVRERETRHVTAVEAHPAGQLLRVEDFFGHAQYGIPAGRPASADYHPGDEVLVTDGVHSSRAKVVAADAGTVVVSGLDPPKAGWKLAYDAPLPKAENPDAPGLFPPGGCHLLKFRPHGTPAYYWGRLDKEWDLTHKAYGRRVLPNFADAPGDLSFDGRPWTTAKDYAQLHEAVRTITGHVIDRYGEAALTFPWSVFNEPDLGRLFWRSDWDELQRFYDYTVDGILRAFEDRGYDSNRVFVGGLELGGIFGTNLKLREFLAHCSPRPQTVKGALPLNAAFADRRLDGKRSKRVEALCRANAGRGSPCDFVSVHAYNASKMMADKLARAKAVALEVDADYYAKLWVNSHESTPEWNPPADPAYADSFLGNGYYSTWCADVACRQLRRATADPRYAYGESIVTHWPWPNPGFGGGNDCVRAFRTDDGRTVTVAMPILHFLGLLNRMGPEYHVLPERVAGGHGVSGMVSRDGKAVRVLLYSHNPLDTESRSEAEFDVTLRLAGVQGPRVTATEYRFDKDHNSYFRLARRELDRVQGVVPDPADEARLRQAIRDLESDRVETQLAGLDALAALGPAAGPSLGAVYQLVERSRDDRVREKASETLKRVTAPKTYPADLVRRVEELSALRVNGTATYGVAPDGVTVRARVAGNGACVLVLEPAGGP